MSRRKTTSLFEVLPPSSPSGDSTRSSSSSYQSEGASSNEPSKGRLKIEAEEPKASNQSSFKPREQAQPRQSASTTRAPVSQQNITVQNGNHFYISLGVMVLFSVATGLFGYKLGNDNGFKEGAQHGASLRAQKQNIIYQKKSISKEQTKKNKISPVVYKKPSLPTNVAAMTPEQKKIITPPAKTKRFTLQVQTFGRNQQKQTKDLVESLKSAGIEAFADYKLGVVYAGRFEAVKNNNQATLLQKRISRFNWRNRNFKEAFFNRIPRSLLKD